MMRFVLTFIRFDDWLIDYAFQPFVNWLGRQFGLTRTIVGEFLLTGSLFCWMVWTWLFATRDDNHTFRTGFYLLMGMMVVLVWGIMFWQAMHMAKRQAQARRQTLFPMRLSTWLGSLPNLIPFGFIELFDMLAFVFAICGTYILSCDDGPRKRKRQRQRRSRLAEQGI